MEFSRPEYRSEEPFPSPGDLPNPGIKPRSPTLQADSLPAEPPRKTKNPGVGSLSLLQWIFPTQESNGGSPALQADPLPLNHGGRPKGLKERLTSATSIHREVATLQTLAAPDATVLVEY